MSARAITPVVLLFASWAECGSLAERDPWLALAVPPGAGFPVVVELGYPKSGGLRFYGLREPEEPAGPSELYEVRRVNSSSLDQLAA